MDVKINAELEHMLKDHLYGLAKDLLKYIIHGFILRGKSYYYIIEDARYNNRSAVNDTFIITNDLKGLIDYVLNKSQGNTINEFKQVYVTIPDDNTYCLYTNFNDDEQVITDYEVGDYLIEKL